MRGVLGMGGFLRCFGVWLVFVLVLMFIIKHVNLGVGFLVLALCVVQSSMQMCKVFPCLTGLGISSTCRGV